MVWFVLLNEVETHYFLSKALIFLQFLTNTVFGLPSYFKLFVARITAQWC